MPDNQERIDVSVRDVDQGDQDSPSTYLSVELTEAERTKLEKWVKGHFDSITQEMAPVLARFEDERNQLEGKMPAADYPYPGAFRVSDPVTKKKVREVANRIKQAYLDSDPIWSVSGKEMRGLFEYVQAVERSLDSLVDHDLEAEDDLSQAQFEAVLHGTGAVVQSWDRQDDVVREIETYEGFDLAIAQMGQVDESLDGLRRFEENYPDWKENKRMRKLHAKLRSGKRVEAEFSYTAVIRNLPEIIHIPIKDVRVYPKVNGHSGLRTTPCYGYVREYTLSELERLAENEAIDADALNRLTQGKQDQTDRAVDDEMEPFEVFIATIRYALPGDPFPVRYKVWLEAGKGILLRIRSYTWWNPNPDLMPLYIRQEDPGFFKNGLAWDLLENQTIASVLMSLFLNAIDMANSMRWKVKHKSMAEQHLLSRRWSPHIPMPWVKGENEVQSMATPTGHIGSIIQGIEIHRRSADEETQTSSLQSGQESPQDPQAPALKSALLLKQMEPNTKEYIRSLEPGMRQIGQSILWAYYQGISLGWVENMPGVPPMPREHLRKMAENLNTRALLFESDRNNLLQSNMLVLRSMREIYGGSRPDLIAHAFRIFVSQVNSQWAKLVNELDLSIPPPAQENGIPNPAAGLLKTGLPGGSGNAPQNGAPRPVEALRP